jgi:exodeoxyribonuclease-3
MKIATYNVNGIRAAIKKGLVDWLKEENPDILCIQEVKATSDQVPEEVFSDLGYNAYWNSAVKKGYSGVLTLSKIKADKVEKGISQEVYDIEGRVLR